MARKFKNKSSITLLTIVSYNSFWIFAPKTTEKLRTLTYLKNQENWFVKMGHHHFVHLLQEFCENFWAKLYGISWHGMMDYSFSSISSSRDGDRDSATTFKVRAPMWNCVQCISSTQVRPQTQSCCPKQGGCKLGELMTFGM